MKKKSILTPSENNVDGDTGVRVGEQGAEYEVVQVEALHEDPRVVGEDAVLPDAGEGLAVDVALELAGQPVALAVFHQDVGRQAHAADEQDVLQEKREGSDHERGEQVHVQDVSLAAQLSGGRGFFS